MDSVLVNAVGNISFFFLSKQDLKKLVNSFLSEDGLVHLKDDLLFFCISFRNEYYFYSSLCLFSLEQFDFVQIKYLLA